MSGIWAVVPVKERGAAKQRIARLLPEALRRELADAMLEDVLDALVTAPGLAGIAVATVEPAVSRLAARYGARVIEDGARDGHTGAVVAAGRVLKAEGQAGMLTVPGDVPLVTAAELRMLLAAHRAAPSFTIAPSHDERGSNAVLMSPPDAVPLRFGDDSFFPHLRAAEAQGIRPTILRLPGIALDIDTPEDLAMFARLPSPTRTRAWLDERGLITTLLSPSPGRQVQEGFS